MHNQLQLDDGRFVARVRPWILQLALLLVRLLHALGFRPTRLAGMLCFGWGNIGWAAGTDYVEAVMTDACGPALECGSGLTTLVLAALGVETHALEHDALWAEHVRTRLRHHGLTSAVVHHAPLRSGGTADWYDWRTALPIDSRFQFVVCDGPPGSTRGGRTGIEEVRHLMARGAVILLDDTARPAESRLMEQWEANAWGRVTHAGTFARMIALT
jgi:hypothetical protein